MKEQEDSATGIQVIDFHAHIYPDGVPDFYQLTGDAGWPTLVTGSDEGLILRGGKPFRRVKPALWNLESRLGELDAAGIGVQVVSPVPVTLAYWAEPRAAGRYCRAVNDAIAVELANSRDRLRGLGAVPLQDVGAAIAELEHIVNDLRLEGAEIGTVIEGRELDHPDFRPFFEAAEQLGAVLAVHPMDGGTGVIRREGQPFDFGIGMLTDTALAAGALVFGGVLDRHPGLRILLAHGCGSYPWVYPRLRLGSQMVDGPKPERLDELTRALWVDSLVFDPVHLGLLAHRFGANHIVMGSDHPFVPGQLTAVPQLVRTAAATGAITEADIAAILSSNALDLLTGC
ncbi:amidohydrolase [Mycolicibacterium sp. CH28]|uniref:amidohydrolase family protein n=1 Tax=Mycolicibacterium sp. CH28 TaxID=2512237 RepID=UPI0010804F9F|nr:amidohydrolase family protein [Mycolicibacterium sp. CH28]TGD85197.1 amidohydrolase [Mycolicibacterium sp. CH28]